MNLEDTIAQYILDEIEEGEDIPRCEAECKEFLDLDFRELATVADKIQSLPCYWCNTTLLELAVKQAIDSIDWDEVIRRLESEKKG